MTKFKIHIRKLSAVFLAVIAIATATVVSGCGQPAKVVLFLPIITLLNALQVKLIKWLIFW
ncbi:MAG: hypothetical protein U0L18_06825 [Acutalibacteraceae bacterium]|nr:hypothetical protein [Acutalibacteraceae bacterium]